jgi:CAF1 family ribonuclease
MAPAFFKECWRRSIHPVLLKVTQKFTRSPTVTSFLPDYLRPSPAFSPSSTPTTFDQPFCQCFLRVFSLRQAQGAMDVDYTHFWAQLVPILRSISQATFIAIDVEMSGISIRRPGVNDRSHSQSKPTLQQQYEETREAAETYQVLQLGITCVKEDLDRGTG